MALIPVPCSDGGGGGTPGRDVEPVLLCDTLADGTVVGSALAVYTYDEVTGAPIGAPTFVDPATGNPYAVQGTLKPCGEQDCPNGTAQVYADCGDVPREQIIDGPNLVENGDFSESTGVGASSSNGPGWSTSYTAADDIFAAGAATYGLFDTNAGQVTGGNPQASQINARSARSIAINVGPDTTQPVICFNVLLTSGENYSFGADMASIGDHTTVSLKIAIDGTDIGPMNTPGVDNTWERTETGFLWTGPSGTHSLCVKSNSAAAAGNDVTMDNFSVRHVTPGQAAVKTPVDYCGTQRAVVEHVVQTIGCNDDRRDEILANIASSAGGAGGADTEAVTLCDDNGTFIRRFVFDGAGGITEFDDTTLGGAAYVPVGTIHLCQPTPPKDVEQQILCDTTTTAGSGTQGEEVTWTDRHTESNPPPQFFGWPATGEIHKDPSPAQNVDFWNGNEIETVPGTLPPPAPRNAGSWATYLAQPAPADVPDCTTGTFNVTYGFKATLVAATHSAYQSGLLTPVAPGEDVDIPTGALQAKIYTNSGFGPLANTSYPSTGGATLQIGDTIEGSTTASNISIAQLANIRAAALITDASSTANGGDRTYTWDIQITSSQFSFNGGPCTNEQFIRHYVYAEDGVTVTSTYDTLLDGTTPYAVVGEVGTCEPKEPFDVETVTLCDDNGAFIRRFVYGADGNIQAQSDHALGGGPYVTVGQVKVCQPEPCNDTECEILCDVRVGSVAATPTPPIPGSALTTTTDAAPTHNLPAFQPLAGGGAAFWSGGTTHFPEGVRTAGNQQDIRQIQGNLTATAPPCADPNGDVQITWTVNVHELGPDAGDGGAAAIQMWNGAVAIPATVTNPVPSNTPVGYQGTTTLQATVPAADLLAGNISLSVALEVEQNSSAGFPESGATIKAWDISGYTLDIEYLDAIPCAAESIPFRRCTTYDCDGLVVSVTDTTLDGQPYTVTETVLDCGRTDTEFHVVCDDNGPFIQHIRYNSVGAVEEVYGTDFSGAVYNSVGAVHVCPPTTEDIEQFVLCDVQANGTVVSFQRTHRYDAATGAHISSTDTTLDGTTAYVPTGTVQACGISAPAADQPVFTGGRNLAASQSVDVKALHAGVQSVTVTALTGSTTVTLDDGPLVLPAGVSMTWSVNDTDDSSLNVLSVATAASSTALVAFTYKAGAAG